MLLAIAPHERELFFPDGFAGFPEAELHVRAEEPITSESWRALLDAFQPAVIVSCWSTPALPPAWSDASSPLRYVCHLVGSVRNLVPRAFLERGGLLTNWGSLAGRPVAEHALLLALSALRNQPHWRSVIDRPVVKPWRSGTMRLQTRSLFRRRVGIHGFGHVARSLVELLRPFDVEIFACSAGVPAALMRGAGVTPCASLAELAARSEVFFECEALTPHTARSVDAAVLAALEDHAVFVNVGRGSVVDESALVNEAASGRLRIALDVVTREPLAPDSPLAALPDAILSPHIGGPTYDHFPDCGRHALANLHRYLNGAPLEACITPELYDRST